MKLFFIFPAIFVSFLSFNVFCAEMRNDFKVTLDVEGHAYSEQLKLLIIKKLNALNDIKITEDYSEYVVTIVMNTIKSSQNQIGFAVSAVAMKRFDNTLVSLAFTEGNKDIGQHLTKFLFEPIKGHWLFSAV